MFKKRNNGRGFDDVRKIEAKVGVIKRADGSAMFKIGNTIAIASVYGPKSLYPKFLQNSNRGILRCNYNMMAFSGSGNRVRPGPSRRSKEISLVTEKALLPALDLSEYPGAVVDIYVELIQTDSGTRSAGICAASLALADAGFKMKDLVSSVAIGRIEDKVVVDVDKEEEDYEGGMADMPVAIMPRTGEVTLLQLDGFAKKEEVKKMVDAAKKACKQIYEIQRKALKEKYK
jgi:exosome complex component RRP41